MDKGMLQGLATLLAMIAFIGVVCWAWSSRRKPDFDAAARLPLAEDEQTRGH